MASVFESDAMADAIARALDEREQERAGIADCAGIAPREHMACRIFPVRRDAARERRRRSWRPRSTACGRIRPEEAFARLEERRLA
jgi:hypothetical protein